MKTEKELPHAELTNVILGCCFEVMNELGSGFQEKVYKNALLIAMRQKGLAVEVERPYDVVFRGKIIGRYYADLVVEQTVIIELKCCESLISEHQAQLFIPKQVQELAFGLKRKLPRFNDRKLPNIRNMRAIYDR